MLDCRVRAHLASHLLTFPETDAELHAALGDQLNLSSQLFTPLQIRRGGFETMGCYPPPDYRNHPRTPVQLKTIFKRMWSTWSGGKDRSFFPGPPHCSVLPPEGQTRRAERSATLRNYARKLEIFSVFGFFVAIILHKVQSFSTTHIKYTHPPSRVAVKSWWRITFTDVLILFFFLL